MFLVTAIAATSCTHASNPKLDPLLCSDTQGSMLGEHVDDQAQTISEFAVQSNDDIFFKMSPSLQSKTALICAYAFLSSIKHYAVEHDGDKENLEEFIASALPKNFVYNYIVPDYEHNGRCSRRSCTSRTAVTTLVQCLINSDAPYESDRLIDAIAFVIAFKSRMKNNNDPELLSLPLPQDESRYTYFAQSLNLFAKSDVQDTDATSDEPQYTSDIRDMFKFLPNF